MAICIGETIQVRPMVLGERFGIAETMAQALVLTLIFSTGSSLHQLVEEAKLLNMLVMDIYIVTTGYTLIMGQVCSIVLAYIFMKLATRCTRQLPIHLLFRVRCGDTTVSTSEGSARRPPLFCQSCTGEYVTRSGS